MPSLGKSTNLQSEERLAIEMDAEDGQDSMYESGDILASDSEESFSPSGPDSEPEMVEKSPKRKKLKDTNEQTPPVFQRSACAVKCSSVPA